MRRSVPALLLVVALAGCSRFSIKGPSPAGSEPAAKAPAVQVDPEEKALEKALAELQQSTGSYRLGSADLVEITVYQEPELQRQVRVGSDGNITFPLIGAVRLGGLEVAEAEARLTQALTRYLIRPQVSIFIKEYGNKMVYVLGEVQKPGSYPLPTESSLSALEAITMAGGLTSYAAPDRARIIRRSRTGKKTLQVPVGSIMRSGDKSKDVALEPNDVVYVPETLF